MRGEEVNVYVDGPLLPAAAAAGGSAAARLRRVEQEAEVERVEGAVVARVTAERRLRREPGGVYEVDRVVLDLGVTVERLRVAGAHVPAVWVRRVPASRRAIILAPARMTRPYLRVPLMLAAACVSGAVPFTPAAIE